MSLLSEEDLTLVFWLAAAGSVLSLVAPFLFAYIFRNIFGGKGKRKKLPKHFDFERAFVANPGLLNASEARFFKLLHQAVEDDFMVLAKVDTASLIRVSTRNRHKEEAFAELSAHPADFVLLTPEDLQVAGIIALDENSGPKSPTAFLEKAARAVNLPFIRFAPNPPPTPDLIAERLASELFSPSQRDAFISHSPNDSTI